MVGQVVRRCRLAGACLLAALLVCCAQKGAPQTENAVEEIVSFSHRDGHCVGPNGFQLCEIDSMWLLARRKDGYSLVSMLEPNPKQMCLERRRSWLPWRREFDVRPSSCTSKGAKSWDMIELTKGYSIQDHMAYLTQHNHKYCLARGRKKYLHTATMINCNREPEALQVTMYGALPFLFLTADGACFDGEVFRKCSAADPDIYFGVGLKFDWSGRPHRYFYKQKEPSKCIVASRSKVKIGSCAESGALDWGWKEGRLTYANGKYCVARLSADQSAAALIKCYEGFEAMSMYDQHTAYAEYTASEQYQEPQTVEQLMRIWQQQQQQQQQQQPGSAARSTKRSSEK